MTRTGEILRIPPDCGAEDAQRSFSAMARAMSASSILTIANEIRELKESGVTVADMTVGDFSPGQFPIPARLRELVEEELKAGRTNYPPSQGEKALREAVRAHLIETQGMDYPLDGIVIVGGGRPALYSVYRVLLDPGELVLYPVPSWNNNNFADVSQVRTRAVQARPEDAFQPTAALLAPHLRDARLIVLNTPQNPSGGVMRRSELEAFGRLLVEENARRRAHGERPLYLLFDQIYQGLVFPGHEHFSPVQLVPECAPWVLHVDGISKNYCATGLRCGWLVGPPAIIRKVTGLLTHLGAWAPRPVQTATARFLREREVLAEWQRDVIMRVRERLEVLYEIVQTLRAEGFPVGAIEPQGAIYMSVRFALLGRRTAQGRTLESGEAVRSWLLKEAAFALVPFSAFGVAPADEDGWFRASVGAVSAQDVRDALPRLRKALASLQPV